MTLPANLVKLDKLNVSKNQLIELDVSAVKLALLKEFDASNNLLKNIDIGADLVSLETFRVGHNRLTQLDLSASDLKELKHLDISINLLEMILLKEQSVFAKLQSIDSSTRPPRNLGYNPFISPIPSNVLIVRSDKKFPQLNEVHVGINDPCMTALWLLGTQDEEERAKLYEQVSRRSFRTVNAQIIEPALTKDWEETELTTDLRTELTRVMQYLRDTPLVPEIYRSQLRNLLLQSHIGK